MTTTCRKRRFRTKTDALVALANTQLNATLHRKHSKTTSRNESRAYRCTDCGGWHLTSSGKQGRSER